MATIEDNKAAARRFVNVWGNGSLETIDELAAPDLSVYYPVLGQPIYGAEAFKQQLIRIHSVFGDAVITSDDIIAEGDKVVVCWTARATHADDLSGPVRVPATGKQVTWSGITIYRFADGKIVEESGQEDFLGVLRQLGAL